MVLGQIMIYPKSLIAWDLETSGLDPKDCKILEIGAIRYVEGKEVERKSWLLNHGIAIPALITKITTIDKALIDREGVDPSTALNEFLSWFDKHGWTNLTHNGFRFDIPFMVEAVFHDGKKIIEVEEIKDRLYRNGVDTASLYKGKELGLDRFWNENFAQYSARVLDVKKYGLKFSISHCCREMGIDAAEHQMHRALGDIHLTHEIYQALITPTDKAHALFP